MALRSSIVDSYSRMISYNGQQKLQVYDTPVVLLTLEELGAHGSAKTAHS